MLAYDRYGSGPPLLLLHGTTSSRHIWDQLGLELAAVAEVIAVDLPGHGESPASSHTPGAWAAELALLLDRLGVRRAWVVGHSSGGWTALELAKLERARAVLALAPAGLWRRRSPLLTDLMLNANWRLGRIAPRSAIRAVRSPTVRSLALRAISAKPAEIPAGEAVAAVRSAVSTESFPDHFRQTRRLRFTGGRHIEVPVRVVWGEQDRIAPAGKSRNREELPVHAVIESWPDCGHMVMWDARARTLAAIRELLSARP